jgi:putative transposase
MWSILTGRLKRPVSGLTMPARLQEFQAGEFYHLYQRGGDRQRIFFESDNYFYFIRLVKRYTLFFKVNIIAYCLLPNHFHLFLQPQHSNNLSAFMRRLQQSHVQAINKRNHRRGPLFYQRFKAKQIISPQTEILLCRYIHVNPLKHSLVRDLEDWPYSNYFEFIGTRNNGLYLPGYREKFFTNPLEYAKFVEAYRTDKDKEIEQWLTS